jgi:hypothetical protein
MVTREYKILKLEISNLTFSEKRTDKNFQGSQRSKGACDVKVKDQTAQSRQFHEVARIPASLRFQNQVQFLVEFSHSFSLCERCWSFGWCFSGHKYIK